MTAVSCEQLEGIYAAGDDPWSFRTSAYEQSKFRATCAALPRRSYRSVLELGCGNGELARHIAPRCAAYTGVDAVQTALDAARRALPEGRFHRLFLPALLPAIPKRRHYSRFLRWKWLHWSRKYIVGTPTSICLRSY